MFDTLSICDSVILSLQSRTTPEIVPNGSGLLRFSFPDLTEQEAGTILASKQADSFRAFHRQLRNLRQQMDLTRRRDGR